MPSLKEATVALKVLRQAEGQRHVGASSDSLTLDYFNKQAK